MAMGPPTAADDIAGGGAGFLGTLGSIFTGGNPILGALGGLLGGLTNARELAQTRSAIQNMAQFNPMSYGGPLGSVNFNQGFGQFSPGQALGGVQAGLGGTVPGLLAGGLFNMPQLQQALGQNNIAGALGQANSALGQSASPFFNATNFGNIQSQVGGLGSLLAGRAASGPQDFSGGLQTNLFSRGSANQAAAGDQSSLYNQQLDVLRRAAQPATDRLFDKLENRLFATGRLGTTGGSLDQEAFFNAVNQQDLGFQDRAFDTAHQQQQLLASLGGQQIGLGSQLLGQNLGQYNQNIAGAQGFLGLGAGIEGQGFNQQLAALRANQDAGLQRLQAAQSLFGLGSNTFNQQYGLGLAGSQGIADQSRLGLEHILGLGNLEVGRIGASGYHSNALANLQGSSGGLLGNLIGGLFG